MYYGTDRGERGRGAAAAGGLIIMIAVGRGDIAIAKHASKNDVNDVSLTFNLSNILHQFKAIMLRVSRLIGYYCTL